MRKLSIARWSISMTIFSTISLSSFGQGNAKLTFQFDENTHSKEGFVSFKPHGTITYKDGLQGNSLKISPDNSVNYLTLSDSSFRLSPDKGFSVLFWIKTTKNNKQPFVILSQKEFEKNNSLKSRKIPAGYYIATEEPGPGILVQVKGALASSESTVKFNSLMTTNGTRFP